jgi:hypothetical protein
VDTIGGQSTIDMIVEAGLEVPAALTTAVNSGERLFNHRRINIGKFFVAQ